MIDVSSEVARLKRQIRTDKLKEQRLSKQVQAPKCEERFNYMALNVKQESLASSTAAISASGPCQSRKEARRIRNRESAVISRKRKMDAMQELTVRCERLENENKYLKSLLMDSTNGKNDWTENRASVNIGPAVF